MAAAQQRDLMDPPAVGDRDEAAPQEDAPALRLRGRHPPSAGRTRCGREGGRPRGSRPAHGARAVHGQPWLVPLADSAAEVLRPLRAPGAGVIPLHLARVVDQRLQDAPGLLDLVLAGEEVLVALQRVVEQPLVGLWVLA